MTFLLDALYLAALAIALPWLLYRRLRYSKYREGWPAKLLGCVPQRRGERPCLWLHAVSVGEVNLLEPILQRWRTQHPEWDIVISTTTQTGYALARRKYGGITVTYCPLDFSWAVRRAMQHIRPTLLVLAELELWPNLIAAAKKHGAKVAVINGRLGEKSFRGYRRIRSLAQRVLRQLDLIAVQNDEYAERFRLLGASHAAIQVTGSIKFDGARTNRENPESNRLAGLAGIEPDDVVFLAGSTQEPEEQIALSAFQRLSAEYPRLRLILVPRHPERFDDVASLLDRSRLPWQRRSTLSADAPAPSLQPPAPKLEPRVLLVDAVGELGHWWGTAQIAFVGGSLTSRGGQNMIEPAGYGCAISFGPNTWNFRDVVAMFLQREAAVVVHSEDELEAFVRRCLAEPAFAQSLGRQAQQLVLEQQGAADQTVALLGRLNHVPVARAA